MDLTPLYRKIVLTAAANQVVTSGALKYGMRLGAARFVAGETLERALEVVGDLNQRGVLATLDYLGEGVHDEHVAREMGQAYLDLLDGIAASGVKSNVSVKPTQMGLAFDFGLAEQVLFSIVRRAAELGNFVRIDMEDTPHTDATLSVYHKLRAAGLENVGTVIQAYLFRSEQDVAELGRVDANLRLVKGAYKEPSDRAYVRIADVNENFRRLIRARLLGGFYTGVATHDERIIEFTRQLVAEHGVSRDRFEFQMLFGVRMQWQEELAREGYKVRCYVPYGAMWYPYFSRRIAESPRNLGFIIKNLFKH